MNNNYALETFITLERQLSMGLDNGKLAIGHSGFTRSNLYKIDKLVKRNKLAQFLNYSFQTKIK